MLSAIICTYNRAKSLGVVLEDLSCQSVPPGFRWELIVVDNNSNDETRAVVEAYAKLAPMPVRYVFESRQGKSYALNLGIDAAEFELLAFTDDDVRIGRDWVHTMATAFDKYDCDIVAGRIRAAWASPPPAWYVTDGPYTLMEVIVSFELGPVAHTTSRLPYGANMGLRKSRVLAVGGFRVDLGPRGNALTRCEDTELGARLLEAGAKCQYVPDVIVDHPVEPHRATRSYVLRWYYYHGKTLVARVGIPAGARRVFGIPLYMVRSVAQNCVRWFAAMDRRRRFFYKLQTYLALGATVECYSAQHKIQALSAAKADT